MSNTNVNTYPFCFASLSQLQISSSRSTSASRAFECEAKADGISISSATLDAKLDEIVVNQTVMESSISRSDVRKSKSKVRTYLKRCKDALYGHSTDETCTVTVNEDLPQSSNTSWYLTTAALESNDSTNKADSDQLPKAMKTNQLDEQEAIDKEIKCMSMTEVLPLVESQVNKVRGGKICKEEKTLFFYYRKSSPFAESRSSEISWALRHISGRHRVIACSSDV
jgi:hypothetical protein